MLTSISILTLVLASARLLYAQQHLSKSVWGSYRCPKDNGTLPSPTYSNEHAVFTVCSQRVISASVDKVYDVLIDMGDYKKWNSFVRSVDNVNGSSISPVDLYTEVVFHNYGLFPPANSSAPAKEIVSVLQHDECDFAVAAWKYDDGLGGVGLRAEHTNVLTTSGDDGSTLYVSWDSYFGAAAIALEPLSAKNLRKQFDNQADDLKRYVEATP